MPRFNTKLLRQSGWVGLLVASPTLQRGHQLHSGPSPDSVYIQPGVQLRREHQERTLGNAEPWRLDEHLGSDGIAHLGHQLHHISGLLEVVCPTGDQSVALYII